MESLKVRQKVGRDGVLNLSIPVGFVDREVEVMVIYQPIKADNVSDLPLDELYGVCADDPISADRAGISDALDDDLVGAFERCAICWIQMSV